MVRCIICGKRIKEIGKKTYKVPINNDLKYDPNGMKEGRACEECTKEAMYGKIG